MRLDVIITKLRKKFNSISALAMAAFVVTSCTNIDCPLDNVVAVTCGLYTAEDHAPMTISDTLTVMAGGVKDTTLLNRAQGIQTFQLPMRQGVNVDTMLFRFSNTSQFAIDTIFCEHTNEPHFESVDCPASVFHNIVSVKWTSHSLSQMPLTIDSVSVTRPVVDYDDIENIEIFLRSTSR